MIKKAHTSFRPAIRSMHPTHDILRTQLPHFNFRSVVRLGSTTDLPDTVTNGGKRVECNTIEAIMNTSDKQRMKRIFKENKIKSPDFITPSTDAETLKWAKDKYPIVIKTEYHSRGRGMVKIDDETQMNAWLAKHDEGNHIFEEYIGYAREYRLHMSQNECFYSFRKMRKSDAKDRWYFNSNNCVWIIESNPQYNKPECWNNIVEECKKALKVLKLDIGGFDVRVSKNGKEFTIIEANSACSFGDITSRRYIAEIGKILSQKYHGAS